MASTTTESNLQTRVKPSQAWRISSPTRAASAACLLFAAAGVVRPLTGSSENYFTIEPGTSTGTGTNLEADFEPVPARLVAELKARSGLTWTQIAQLFGVTRRAVHLWVEGGSMSTPNRERLGELHTIVSRSGQTDPSAVRQWLLSAESGSTRTRFAVLVGPYIPLVPEDGRRLAETLGTGEPISAPLGGKVKRVASAKKSTRTTF